MRAALGIDVYASIEKTYNACFVLETNVIDFWWFEDLMIKNFAG